MCVLCVARVNHVNQVNQGSSSVFLNGQKKLFGVNSAHLECEPRCLTRVRINDYEPELLLLKSSRFHLNGGQTPLLENYSQRSGVIHLELKRSRDFACCFVDVTLDSTMAFRTLALSALVASAAAFAPASVVRECGIWKRMAWMWLRRRSSLCAMFLSSRILYSQIVYVTSTYMLFLTLIMYSLFSARMFP